MDDQQTYLLNGLLTRHFAVGRIVRFRPVTRGRQAQCFELFTAEEKEYLAYLFPPDYDLDALNRMARTLGELDRNCFSVMPFLQSKTGEYVAEGPQGRRLMLSLAPAGSALETQAYSAHDISQVGLRLGWMHRLLKDVQTAPQHPMPVADHLPADAPAPLRDLLRLPVLQGWVHGDIQTDALLHDSDRQLRAVMDWGLLHWGCPLEDLVDAFLALCLDPKGNPISARGTALLEAYDSLVTIRRVAWTPVVAHWGAQRLVEGPRRAIPEDFLLPILTAPERVATAMASCL